MDALNSIPAGVFGAATSEFETNVNTIDLEFYCR
jgi:hypothetical protein